MSKLNIRANPKDDAGLKIILFRDLLKKHNVNFSMYIEQMLCDAVNGKREVLGKVIAPSDISAYECQNICAYLTASAEKYISELIEGTGLRKGDIIRFLFNDVISYDDVEYYANLDKIKNANFLEFVKTRANASSVHAIDNISIGVESVHDNNVDENKESSSENILEKESVSNEERHIQNEGDMLMDALLNF